MKKINDIIRVEILDCNETNKDFKVKDVMYFNNSVFAFIVNKSIFLKDCYIIRFNDILSFEKDAIVIPNKTVIQKVNIDIQKSKYIKENDNFYNHDIITKSGENLGFIKEIIFDEDNGKIIAFILSDGIIEDILNGRKIVPIVKGIKYLDNDIIFPNYIKELINNKEIYKNMLE